MANAQTIVRSWVRLISIRSSPISRERRSAPPCRITTGLPRALGEDLDLAPANPAHASAERLHHGFLAREAGCELRGAVATVVKLALGIDALEEALAVPIEHALKALQQQQVDAAGEVGRHWADRITVHCVRSPARRARLRRVRGARTLAVWLRS